MLYQGQFKSVLKDKLYTVNIITNGSSTGKVDIVLGPNSFVTEMDSGSNTIYVPVKYSSAAVQIVANNYYFDMYASTAKQNAVQLLDASSNILWTGYTSPNIYDAPYDFITESWKVEAIDGLSVLKYYDYTPINGTMGFASFTEIINHCLSTCGCYSKWYFSTATHIPDKNYLTDKLYISEANFIDEDDDSMKMNEVLEEICKFCGVTAVASGTSVYFIDYDAIGGSTHTYYEHTVGNNSAVTSTTSISSSHTIEKESYSSTGTNLSLDNVYSKVTVRDSLYTVKSILPSMFENEDLRNVHYVDEDNQNWTYEEGVVCMDKGEKTGKNQTDDDTYFQIRGRFYTNDKYEYNWYDPSTGSSKAAPGPSTDMFLYTQNVLGGLFTKYDVGTGETSQKAYNSLSNENLNNYLMIPVNHTTKYGKVLIESKPEFSKPFFMSSNAKLVAKGSMILVDRANYDGAYSHEEINVGYFPCSETLKSNYDRRGWWIFARGTEIGITKKTLQLTIGVNSTNTTVAFYPNGEDNEWLYENKKTHEIFFQNFEVQNNIAPSDNINEKGYKINTGLAANTVTPLKPVISIYSVDTLIQLFGDLYSHIGFNPEEVTKTPVGCVFIKDFDIVAVIPHEGGKDENDTNTEYSYVIDDDYVSELGSIEFKICTYDNKQLNYSAVAWLDPSTNKYEFVDTLTHDPTGQTQRSEHLLCYKIVNQYQSPAKKLSINLFEEDIKPWTKVHEPLLNTDFIVSSVSYNYYFDRADVNLVEKQ